MSESVVVAVISAIGLILAGILVELIRGRRQLNQTLTDIDRRLLVVETTIAWFLPMPPGSTQSERER